jgi:hypothetical protein
MKANSDTKPNDIIKCKEKSIVNYNIKEVEMTDPETEKKRKVWEYDYVEIKGEVTKAKFKDALRKNDEEKKDKDTWMPDGAVIEYEEKIAK